MPHDMQHFELDGGVWKELWFPGAEGHGRFSIFDWSPGGFHVQEVDDLGNSGPGTLRDEVTGSWAGSRVVVFRTGSTIGLASPRINVTDGPLIVAGQTAPGGGIQIRGASGNSQLIRIQAAGQLWQHLRIRNDKNGSAGSGQMCIRIELNSNQDISDGYWDHLSVYWNWDDNAITHTDSSSTKKMQRFSIGRCIFAESLAGHSTAIAIFGNITPTPVFELVEDVSIFMSLIANTQKRTPLARTKGVQLTNIIVYNWSDNTPGEIEHSCRLDAVNCYWYEGPMSPSGRSPMSAQMYDGWTMSLYASGCARTTFPAPAADQWAVGMWEVNQRGTPPPNTQDPVPAGLKRGSADPNGNVTVMSLQDFYDSLVVDRDVGAVWQLDDVGGWQSNEDATDTQTLDDVRDDTGPAALVVSPATSPSGGHPVLAAGVAPVITHVDCHIPDTVVESVGWWLNKNLNNDEKLDRWGIPCMKHYICGTKPNWRGSSVRAGI